MIGEEGFRHVIIAGVDSYLSAATLAAYQEQHRILADDNNDGFIPGEAGSAIVVTSSGRGGGLSIIGMGFAREYATVLSGVPLRGDGLSKAISDALMEAGLAMRDLDFRITDIGGEQYGFKEASLALSRTLHERKEVFEMWQPADCIGEVGAASLPCMLGIALAAARKGYAPARNVLCHLANDDGRRVALIVQVHESADEQQRLRE
jgi:3-oxoacyl-[acyl-carrier-protein] synthase-1